MAWWKRTVVDRALDLAAPEAGKKILRSNLGFSSGMDHAWNAFRRSGISTGLAYGAAGAGLSWATGGSAWEGGKTGFVLACRRRYY